MGRAQQHFRFRQPRPISAQGVHQVVGVGPPHVLQQPLAAPVAEGEGRRREGRQRPGGDRPGDGGGEGIRSSWGGGFLEGYVATNKKTLRRTRRKTQQGSSVT